MASRDDGNYKDTNEEGLDDILLNDDFEEDHDLDYYMSVDDEEAAATVEFSEPEDKIDFVAQSNGRIGSGSGMKGRRSGRQSDSNADERTGSRTKRKNHGGRTSGNGNVKRTGKAGGKGKGRKKNQSTLMAMAAVAAAIVLLAGWFIITRYSPSTNVMSGYEYFDMTGDDGVLLMVDGENISSSGKLIDNRVYLTQEDVEEYINVRFYYDAETGGVLYADSSTIYTYMPDATNYSDDGGKIYSEDNAVIKSIDGVIYIDFEYVAKRTSCTYSYGHGPERVSVRTSNEEIATVKANTKATVRYRAGYKSDILEKVNKDSVMYYEDTVDNWYKVVTESGYTGYVKASEVSDVTSTIPEYEYKDVYNNIKKDAKVSMGWFQVTTAAANSNVDALVSSANGMNTISPTWYTISDAAGNLSSILSSDVVRRMHALGLEVWPLVNDFDKDIDYQALFASKKARANMINQLVWDASNYGYDGLNIDFENVKKEYAADYLQFIRELSVMCEKVNIVLSTDNYKPESFNSFYNLKEQAAFVDYVIIMGYDEHYSGSEAGSVASLPFVEEGIKSALEQVPSSQLINAIPFYTRLWTVSSAGTTSTAVGMQSALDAVSDNGGIAMWDEESGQYVCSYDKDGAQVRIWLEEEKSIEAKMKLYSAYNLGGVAQWKLGLERAEVWDIISAGMSY